MTAKKLTQLERDALNNLSSRLSRGETGAGEGGMSGPFQASPILAARVKDVTVMAVRVPAELHPESKRLLQAFAEELAAKMRGAELKYGYSDHWLHGIWDTECRAQMREHIEKGDPRDVAIYAAFMWARGWPIVKLIAHDQRGDTVTHRYSIQREDGKGVWLLFDIPTNSPFTPLDVARALEQILPELDY